MYSGAKLGRNWCRIDVKSEERKVVRMSHRFVCLIGVFYHSRGYIISHEMGSTRVGAYCGEKIVFWLC